MGTQKTTSATRRVALVFGPFHQSSSFTESGAFYLLQSNSTACNCSHQNFEGTPGKPDEVEHTKRTLHG